MAQERHLEVTHKKSVAVLGGERDCVTGLTLWNTNITVYSISRYLLAGICIDSGPSLNNILNIAGFHLSGHDQTRGLVADLVDHSSISSTQLTNGVKIIIL